MITTYNKMENDYDFRGPLKMYKKCGFDVYAE